MDKKNHRFIRFILLALLCLGASLVPMSCGSDEPDLLVGYYLRIDSQVRLSFYEQDEEQGTSADPQADVLSNTILKLRAALKEAYPEPTYEGDDAAVITALDNIYKKYKRFYSHLERGTVCTVKLYRAKLDNGIVVNSKPMTVFLFGALPPTYEEPDW